MIKNKETPKNKCYAVGTAGEEYDLCVSALNKKDAINKYTSMCPKHRCQKKLVAVEVGIITSTFILPTK